MKTGFEQERNEIVDPMGAIENSRPAPWILCMLVERYSGFMVPLLFEMCSESSVSSAHESCLVDVLMSLCQRDGQGIQTMFADHVRSVLEDDVSLVNWKKVDDVLRLCLILSQKQQSFRVLSEKCASIVNYEVFHRVWCALERMRVNQQLNVIGNESLWELGKILFVCHRL